MSKRRNYKKSMWQRLAVSLGLLVGLSYFAAQAGIGVGVANAAAKGNATSYAVTDCSSYQGAPIGTPLGGSYPGSLGYGFTSAGVDTINFACSGSGTATISIPSMLEITKNLTLQWQSGNSVTLDGGNAVQVIKVDNGFTFTLNNLTIANGSAVSGGAIYNDGGTINITNDTFTGNSATASGGAIYSSGVINVTGSTFVNNSAVDGGAIYVTGNSANGSVKNSTFQGNHVSVTSIVAGGGAIEVNAGILNLVSNTIVGNSVTATISTFYARSGGIYNSGGTISVVESILADNTMIYGSTGQHQQTSDCSGSISDNGFNIESGTDCEFTKRTGNSVTPDQQSVSDSSLGLGSLADNGGPTKTIALANGSVAINKGAFNSDCSSVDQRGYGRVQGCDIGAFEFRAPVLTNFLADITMDIATDSNTPGNITSLTVTWTDPTATEPDSKDIPTVSCTPAAGKTFYVGTTRVTCTARDKANPPTVASESFNVIVKNSNDVPTLNVPDYIRVQATGVAGASVNYSVTALDLSYPSSQLTLSCVKHGISNSSVGTNFSSSPYPVGTDVSADFPIGVTQIDCTATNPAGKTVSNSFSVEVDDYPTVDVPSTITVPADSASGSVVNFTVAAKDAVYASSQLTISCIPDSGSTFPIGTTLVTCNASNPISSSSATFNVVVEDIPTLSVPEQDVMVNSSSVQGASVDLKKYVSASDQYLANAVSASCWLHADESKTNIYAASPVFPIIMQGASTQVDCQASNQPASGPGFQSKVESFNIKVQDTLKPLISMPDTITVNATTPKGAVVTYNVGTRDPFYASSLLTPSCWNDTNESISYPAGFGAAATFPIGTTLVDCRVSNPSNGYATGSFSVVVLNKLQPTLYLPSTITVDATSPDGANVSYSFKMSDPIYPMGQLRAACSPESGSTFAIRTTTVYCRVTNPLGTNTYGSFAVEVRDAGTQISALILKVNGFHLQSSMQSQLDSQLNNALANLKANKSSKASDWLNTFILTVRNKLTSSQAHQLVAPAVQIQAVLGG